jgi:quinol monooxygenase YgiN
MLIVAGHLTVDPAAREAYLAGCVAVVNAARVADGCLDFALSPDLADPGRINVFERWTGEPELLAFRGAGPSGDQQAAILRASVRRYEISAEGPP